MRLADILTLLNSYLTSISFNIYQRAQGRIILPIAQAPKVGFEPTIHISGNLISNQAKVAYPLVTADGYDWT